MSFFGKASTLNLALQGGGAHGAFTWGVLDALLEDGRLSLDGVSGSSAGAMNAVLLAQGLMDGGREGARAALAGFWTAVAAAAPDGIPPPMIRLLLHWTHYLSPEQINPFDLNPLRRILAEQVDFERLRRESPVKLFIAATNVGSGRLRLFRNAELSADALLASACLPTLHRSIEIDGEAYWDGGYTANPTVFPLFYECKARDTLLVLLTPLKHERTPVSAADIQTRVMEIAFASTFLREMRMFAHVQRHLPGRFLGLQFGRLERRVQRSRFHLIAADAALGEFGAETKMAANLKFFDKLKTLGRAQGQQWLAAHFDAVGRRSTIDLEALFY